jgi:2-amino-4-hydroxy-6-hydroxymethyldihydropteridine diphosphokinase
MTQSPHPSFVDSDTLTGQVEPVRRGVLSLGSNLGERKSQLQGAVASLADTPDVFVVAVSPVYDTEPVDAPEGSKHFLNAVVLLDTTLDPHTLLERAQAIESAFGREPSEVRNAPRTLDVDLIMVGDDRLDDDDLTLPHPRAHERAFVLAPWADVDPEAELPEGPISDLLAKVGTDGVLRRDDIVLELQ